MCSREEVHSSALPSPVLLVMNVLVLTGLTFLQMQVVLMIDLRLQSISKYKIGLLSISKNKT